jgi:hypothetical protein
LAPRLAPALKKTDRGPAVNPLSLPEGFQADLSQLEDTADALIERQAGESLAISTAKIVCHRAHAQSISRTVMIDIFPLTS